jgi:hypothetical protein
VSIQRNRRTNLSAEELVYRHARAFCANIPKRAVDPGKRIVQGHAAAEIRRHIRRLPDILDALHALALAERAQVLIDSSLHRQRTLAVRGAADPVQTRLTRQNLHNHQMIAADLRGDRLHVGNSHGTATT